MPSIRLRSVELGEGRPKVCVPLVAATIDDLQRVIDTLVIADLDLVELRADHLAGCAAYPTMAVDASRLLRAALPVEVPILFTFRTPAEGGVQAISGEQYQTLLLSAIASGDIDAVDIEQRMPLPHVEAIMRAARSNGVATVTSNHDFEATPPKHEILARLDAQRQLGADVVKIAVMPGSPADVVTLLDATAEFAALYPETPLITMSMGALGVVSRISGETFGSCLSFGSLETASAPGQLTAQVLRPMLDALHSSVDGQSTATAR